MIKLQRNQITAIIAIPAFAVFTIFYLLPNAFGYLFISNETSPIFLDNELVGIKLKTHNSYFMPITVGYDGADLDVDIFDRTGAKVYAANFVDEYLHDDEEGYKHVARIHPGTQVFNLRLTESSQYFRTSELPILGYGKYEIVGKAFGIEVRNTDSYEQLTATALPVNNGTIEYQFTDGESDHPYYKYQPHLALSNSNYDVTTSGALQLTNYTMAFWFKTAKDFVPEEPVYILTKGGTGIDALGSNMNYGIWMTADGKIRAGFEAASGSFYIVTSSSSYNDGGWHYVASTFDGEMLKLYIDGVHAERKLATELPDNGSTQPIRIGANLFGSGAYFKGAVDEVRIWNKALSGNRIAEQYNEGVFTPDGQVLYLPFG